MTEFHRLYRPALFKDVIGQEEAVRMLSDFLKQKRMPHALLLYGPSGCGKTTLARIIKSKLNCDDGDFAEYNAAETRGIDTIREVKQRAGLAPLWGGVRMFLFDEAHKLSSDAQNALLKILEDTPRHVYFILATTEPEKLIPTIRNRCTDVRVKALSVACLEELVGRVCASEGKRLDEEVRDRIVEYADGSARRVLSILHAIINFPDKQDQLDTIVKGDVRTKAIELARLLIFSQPQWKEVAAMLQTLDEDPETLRRMILSYTTKVLLQGGKGEGRAFFLIDVFKESFFTSGRAGLIAACYAVTTSK